VKKKKDGYEAGKQQSLGKQIWNNTER